MIPTDSVPEPSRVEEPLAISASSRPGALFWIVCALVAISVVAGALATGAGGWIALVLALLPALPLVATGLWLDRFEPEPPWLLARTFLWGAGIATGISGIANTTVAEILGRTAAIVASAPLVEEALKGVAVLWVFRHHREHLQGVKDGIVYALFVGLGFSVLENTNYYFTAVSSDGRWSTCRRSR